MIVSGRRRRSHIFQNDDPYSAARQAGIDRCGSLVSPLPITPCFRRAAIRPGSRGTVPGRPGTRRHRPPGCRRRPRSPSGAVSGFTPPSTLSSTGSERASIRSRSAPDLPHLVREERLAPVTRVHRHHQNQVADSQRRLEQVLGGAGIERDTRLLPQFADPAQRAVEMRTGLDVDRDEIGARGGKRLHGCLCRLDHQVDVQRQTGMRAERPDDGGAEGQLRDEMPVHHIDVNEVGARGLHGPRLASQRGEVSR